MGTVVIAKNDGSGTLYYRLWSYGGKFTVTSTGATMLRYTDMGYETDTYTYSGDDTFLGFATSSNATVPVYTEGYSVTLSNSDSLTVYVVSGVPPVTYKKLTYDSSKVQVESAIRDGNGVKIDTNYVRSNTSITGATKCKITYDSKGLVTTGADLSASDIPSLSWSKITSGKPTTLSGYGITDAKIESGTITLGSNTITPLSSDVLADYVQGPASSTANHIATYSDATGKIIKDSGFTIGKSVPSDAVFTDTWTAMVGATSSANGSVGYVNAQPPKDGYNTKFLRADGTWSVPPDNNTTYSAGTGLSLSGTTINHSNSVTAETTGKGSATAIPIIKYDAQGHITSVTTTTVYPPTTAGTNGQLWESDGSGAGVWVNQSALTPGVTIATDSGTNALTLAHNTKYKLTVGASTFIFTTPTDNNSDTKVRQTLQTGNYNLPLLMSYKTTGETAADVDNICYRNNSIYANTSTNSIFASYFRGTSSVAFARIDGGSGSITHSGDTLGLVKMSDFTTNDSKTFAVNTVSSSKRIKILRNGYYLVEFGLHGKCSSACRKELAVSKYSGSSGTTTGEITFLIQNETDTSGNNGMCGSKVILFAANDEVYMSGYVSTGTFTVSDGAGSMTHMSIIFLCPTSSNNPVL